MALVERVLLTNDDGFDAPGLAVLEEIARDIAQDVWIVAPETDQSGQSHAVTLTRPLRIRQRRPSAWSVDGTPSDCIALGIGHLMAVAQPDLVLSGVNRGVNLADEVHYSGTVGAAATASMLGLRAIALSQGYRGRADVPWETARVWAAPVIAALCSQPWPTGLFYNVNFPNVSPAEVCGVSPARQGQGRITGIGADRRTDHRGGAYFWLDFQRNPPDVEASAKVDLGPGTDSGVLLARQVAVTPIGMNRTHDSEQKELTTALASIVAPTAGRQA